MTFIPFCFIIGFCSRGRWQILPFLISKFHIKLIQSNHNFNNFCVCLHCLKLFIFISFVIGYNGRIEYSITAGDDNNDFTILSNGTIRTQHALDRETIPMYSLVVTARDCAKEPEKKLTSTVQVGDDTIYEQHFIYRLK